VARILIVEDNYENVELMTYLLRAFGHEPVAVMSGPAALEVAAGETFDVVLLDIQMPGMDGFETARELRKLSTLADVPLVAVTALAMVGDRERILEAGFSGYISKPLDAERLPGQLATFLPPDRPA
jgi:two-component system cell cycle response regulator